jgi:hypothetical protein
MAGACMSPVAAFLAKVACSTWYLYKFYVRKMAAKEATDGPHKIFVSFYRRYEYQRERNGDTNHQSQSQPTHQTSEEPAQNKTQQGTDIIRTHSL